MKVDKSLLSGSTTLLVLSLLKTGDMYGYEMIAELSRRSDKTFELKEGTLYPILHGLEQEKCVRSYEKEAPTGRVRKYYHITKKGLKRLEEKPVNIDELDYLAKRLESFEADQDLQFQAAAFARGVASIEDFHQSHLLQ